MKTAMQKLIEIINNKRKESDISNTLLRFCQVEAEKLLSLEKQQIIDANVFFMNTDGITNQKKLAEQYYKETYNKL